MARFTLRAELQPVAIVLPARPVTVETLRGRALVDTLQVARFARHVPVPTVQWKRRLVVKGTACRIELREGRHRTQQHDRRGNEHDAQ